MYPSLVGTIWPLRLFFGLQILKLQLVSCFNPLHVVPGIIIPFLATSSQSTINFLPTITGWWYTYPSEKYISQLGLWHSQNMESHSKFHGSSHHQPDQLPTINFQPNCYSKCYSVAAHSLMACRFEGAMMWCENMARRPSVTGPPARRPCHSGAGIGESWNNFRHGEKWLIDDFPIKPPHYNWYINVNH